MAGKSLPLRQCSNNVMTFDVIFNILYKFQKTSKKEITQKLGNKQMNSFMNVLG